MPTYNFPPDTRQTGGVNPAGDFDSIDDLVGLLYSLLGQLAGAGTNLDPGGNATNLTAVENLRTAAALAPGVAGTVLASNGASSEPTFQRPNYALLFGDGSDGAVTFDGTSTVLGISPSGSAYTLNRDIFCTSVTINSGVTVQTGSFRIFARGTLTNGGTIDCSGKSATSSTGAGTTQGSNGSIRAGQGGGAGGSTTGNAGSAANTSYGVGTAGAGGNGTGGNTGGAAGTTSHNTETWWLRSEAGNVVTGNHGGGNTPLSGGAGGGGGGGDGTNLGGGGGGGGGYIMLLCFALVNNGIIQAPGGNGFTPATGNCGGGGAGAGGAILAYTLSAVTGSGSTNVAAGTPGSGVGTGATGGTGTAGTYLNVIVQ